MTYRWKYNYYEIKLLFTWYAVDPLEIQLGWVVFVLNTPPPPHTRWIFRGFRFGISVIGHPSKATFCHVFLFLSTTLQQRMCLWVVTRWTFLRLPDISIFYQDYGLFWSFIVPIQYFVSYRDRQTVMLFEFCTKIFLNYLCKVKNRILSNFQGLSKKPRQEVHKFILQQHPIRKLLSNAL